MTPQRVQRSRAAGSRMPDGAVYVGRGTRWGNPFRAPPLEKTDGREVAALRHELWLTKGFFAGEITSGARTYSRADVLDHVAELAGKTLACWCPPGPCHADTLMRLAARACNAAATGREAT